MVAGSSPAGPTSKGHALTSPRAVRRIRARSKRQRYAILAAVVVGTVATVALAVGVAKAMRDTQPLRPVAEVAVSEATTLSAAAVEAPPRVMEVPSVVGKPLSEAEMILSFAGFTAEREVATSAPAAADRRVVDQRPSAGTKLQVGATVILVYAPESQAPKKTKHFVVCIDPGHQARANLDPEPVGPGSRETKPKVSGGATGVGTRIPEYEITLQIANRLKKRLEDAGVQVVMTRTKADVDISNAQRAAIANRAGADLFVRIHADGNPDADVAGISTLYPAKNRWTGPIAERSLLAAKSVQANAVSSTEAIDRGVVARTDITGFNHSKVPAILVECGFLSNAVEDKLLASARYQDRLADGIAAGVLSYLRE